MTSGEYSVIYETVHGSRAYELAGGDSDLDLKGVIVGPPAWYHGFLTAPEQVELSKDHVLYEVRKFFRLAAAANPTIIELLWTEPSDHRVVAPAGERLLAHRSEFLSKRVQETFVGYALSQLKRIKGHRSWLLSPPKQEPTRKDYGLPETTLIPKDHRKPPLRLPLPGQRPRHQGDPSRPNRVAPGLDHPQGCLRAPGGIRGDRMRPHLKRGPTGPQPPAARERQHAGAHPVPLSAGAGRGRPTSSSRKGRSAADSMATTPASFERCARTSRR